MDVATQSGMGAGMTGAQMMSYDVGRRRSGDAQSRLAAGVEGQGGAAPEADHLIPPGLQMGASLPLVTPVREAAPPAAPGMPMQQPKGRMLIYWGCGEHVSAGQPTVIDFSKMTPGKVPPGMAAMASMAHVVSGPSGAPGFGRWPNDRDSRQVPASGSLLGAHQVQGNYSPPIAFSLGAGQDFMPGLGLREAGTLPSGADRLMWQPAAQATGYALAMFGSNGGGDVVMWSSARSASMAAMDYLAPAEVRRLIAAGSVLPPSASECLLPAEVAAASPAGMVMMIGYGPEANFAEKPKAPKWTDQGALQDHGVGDARNGRDDGRGPRRRASRPRSAATAGEEEAALRDRRLDPGGHRRSALGAAGKAGSAWIVDRFSKVRSSRRRRVFQGRSLHCSRDRLRRYAAHAQDKLGGHQPGNGRG